MELHGAVARRSAGWPSHCCCGCKTQFAPGGLLHFGQGKWYPGEPLPRWALGMLLAQRRQAAVAATSAARARRRQARPPRRDATLHRARSRSGLGFSPAYVLTAYEDVPRCCSTRSASCPSTSIRSRTTLADPAERARLARNCCAGLDEPVGLRAAAAREKPSARRTTRRARGRPARGRCAASTCCCVVGAIRRSASGCRSHRCRTCLARRRADLPHDPFAPRAGTRPAQARRRRARCVEPKRVRRHAARSRSRRRSPSSCATARCTCSCRRSSTLEDYVALIGAVEATRASAAVRPCASKATAAARSAHLNAAERHARSRRDRSEHPSGRAWDELVANTTRRCTRRRARRGLAPRSSCSTAATPAPAAAITSRSAAQRPRTARCCAGPTCCKASITYWQNHPALSYLFSGHVRRPDEPGAARGRGARRPALRARDRVPADRARRRRPARNR